MNILLLLAFLPMICHYAHASQTDNDLAGLIKKINETLVTIENSVSEHCKDQPRCSQEIKNSLNELQESNAGMEWSLDAFTKEMVKIQEVMQRLNPSDTNFTDIKNNIEHIQNQMRTINKGVEALTKSAKKSCDDDGKCCEKIKKDIDKILEEISTISEQIQIIQTTLTKCCDNQEVCCVEISEIKQAIIALTALVTQCCNEQRACCTTLTNLLNTVISMLQNIEDIISNCCTGGGGNNCTGPCFLITQADIPLVITKTGTWVLVEDVVFPSPALSKNANLNTQTKNLKNVQQLQQSQQADFAITIAVGPVFLNLNAHSITIIGTNVGAISALQTSRSIISTGQISGNNAVGQFGIAIASPAASVSNVVIAGIAAAPAAAAPAAAAVAAPAAAAAAIAVAAAAVAAASTSLLGDVKADPVTAGIAGILIQNVAISDSLYGLSLNGPFTNVLVKNVSINRCIMGIVQPARSGFHGNFIFENIGIANSTLNGIYITFNQDNWSFNNCQIRNSGLNGAIFEGTQNLIIKNSQITQSGAKGLVASIRQSQNVDISGLEIFNSNDEALRVDNVQNLSVTKGSFINYVATNSPIVKIQDVNNGLISNNKIMSAAGLADGLFIRNSHGLIVDNNLVKVFANAGSAPIITPPAPIKTNALGTFIQSLCPTPTPPFPTPPAQGNNSGTGPIGINLQGGVTAMHLSKCVVSGTPTTGIALLPDTLNGTDEGIVIEDCTVDGAQINGILCSNASNCAILGSSIVNGQGDGIFIDKSSSRCAVRDNTLTSNRGFGIRNNGINSQIYHNFASGNGQNFSPGILQTVPRAGVGSLENING